MSGVLEATIMVGNRGHRKRTESVVVCVDGFTVSVIAGGGTYCSPKPALCSCGYLPSDDPVVLRSYNDAPHDYPGPYQEVELGFPAERPEPWEVWGKYAEDPDVPMGTVYSYVPVELVRALVRSHGGEV